MIYPLCYDAPRSQNEFFCFSGSLPNGDAIPLEATDIHRYRTKDRTEALNRKLNPYPRELKKVGVAALFVFCNFLATGTSLAIVHEYYPLIEPLPGKIEHSCHQFLQYFILYQL